MRTSQRTRILRAAVIAGVSTSLFQASTRADDAAVEVEVRGDAVRAEEPTKDASVAGSVVRGEPLRSAGIHATDVLRTQPGVQVIESGGVGTPATASIRGATAADTPVYLGGVRLNDDVGGTADLSLIPLWLIDRIEIYRGNAPIEADRLGPGGAIFFEPKRPSRTMAGAGGTVGSFGAKSGFGYAGFSAGRSSFLVGVSADASENNYRYLNDQGTLLVRNRDTIDERTNADTHTLDGWGLGRVDLGNGARVDVMLSGISREQGVPGLALLPAKRTRSTTERALSSIGATVPFGPDSRHVFEARTSAVLSRMTFRDPLAELALQTVLLEVSARRVEQALSVNLELSPTWRIRPSVSLAYERIFRFPDDVPLGRSHRFFARAATTVEVRPTNLLVLRGLFAGECHATRSSETDACDVIEPSGRLGAELGDSDIKLLGNVGRYVRVPTLGEVFGVSGVIRGNPELDPERGFTAELGVRAHANERGVLRGAYADVFLFVRAADNLIAYVRAGQGYVIPYNVGTARVIGAEALLGVALSSFLRADVAATLQDPRDTSAERTTVNDILPFRSRMILAPRVAAFHDFEGSPVLSRVDGSVSYTHQASRYADPAGLGLIAEQGSLDVTAQATWFHHHWVTRARVADLFDQRRTDVIGYPLPGRSAFFSLETTW